FRCVAAAVARAFELVLVGLPVRRATQMDAARVDHEQPVGLLRHPDAVSLFILLVNAKRKVRRITDGVNRARLKEGAGEEEPQKHEKVGRQIPQTAVQISRRRSLLGSGFAPVAAAAATGFAAAGG